MQRIKLVRQRRDIALHRREQHVFRQRVRNARGRRQIHQPVRTGQHLAQRRQIIVDDGDDGVLLGQPNPVARLAPKRGAFEHFACGSEVSKPTTVTTAPGLHWKEASATHLALGLVHEALGPWRCGYDLQWIDTRQKFERMLALPVLRFGLAIFCCCSQSVEQLDFPNKIGRAHV